MGVARLMKEEDKLRREHLDLQMASSEDPMSDKERMILMQQKKIAALDAVNRRLLEELNRMTSQKVSVTTNPVTVTSINTSSPPDRRVSSSSSSSNKSITVITNGEATTKSNSLNALQPPRKRPKQLMSSWILYIPHLSSDFFHFQICLCFSVFFQNVVML